MWHRVSNSTSTGYLVLLDRLKLPLHWVSRVSATTSESVPRFHSHCPYSLRLSQNSVAGSRVDLPLDSISSMVW